MPHDVFLFLETLPNLVAVFSEHNSAPIRLQDLHFFVTIAQKTALRKIHFALPCDSVASGPPIPGPEGMESISVDWYVSDNPDEPGSSMAHLSEFLRPSLRTLTCLEIRDYDRYGQSINFSTLDFRDVGPSSLLHTLKYSTLFNLTSNEPLKAIGEMFPNLIYLRVEYETYGDIEWPVWTVCLTFNCWAN